MKNTTLKVEVILLGLSLVSSCATNSSASRNQVRIDGSSTVYPITQLIVNKLKDSYPGTAIVTNQQTGTEAGFKRFCDGQTDINSASRPILLREMDACKQKGVSYLEIPIAFDAITIVVNPKNNWAKDITIEELKKLWNPAAKGKINTWDRVRASWPKQPIHLYGSDKNSGTLDYFTTALGLPEHSVRSDYTSNSDYQILAQKVGEDPAALGYFGYGYYMVNANRLRLLAVDSGKGAVLPSAEALQKAKYQPFSRPLMLYVNSQRAQINSAAKAFIEYYLKHADELVKEAGYFSLPEKAYQMNTVHFYQNKTGTVFAGETQTGVTIPQLLRKKALF